MYNLSKNEKKWPHRAVMGFIFTLIVVFGVFGLTSLTKATNNYIDNTSFYKNDSDQYILEFNTKTSFTWGSMFSCYNSCSQGKTGTATFRDNDLFFSSIYQNKFVDNLPYCYTDLVVCGGYGKTTGFCDMVAGNTYKVILDNFTIWDCSSSISNVRYFKNLTFSAGDEIILKSGMMFPSGDNDESVLFSEKPSLDISYPSENANISQAFYVQGNYTVPAGSGLDTLLVMVNEVGNSGITYYGFFQEDLTTSGSVNVRVSGLATGNYELFFAFMEYDDDQNIFIAPLSIPINILDYMPPELPDSEQTPPAFFGVVGGTEYYSIHSNYATSTDLFLNLISAVEPIIITIGDNLTFFSANFDQDIAKETGQKTGDAVLMIRSYSSNLNTFFNNLPVAEFLFFYLTLLIVVIVFRLIKNLLGIAKP